MASLALCLAVQVVFTQTATISPSPYLVTLNNAGDIIVGGCIWTYTAGTTTLATTYSASTISVPNQNANPIIADSAGRFTAFLVPGSSYKFVYENIPCSASSHGSTLRTADNITAMPGTSNGVDIILTAGEAITAGQVVYLSAGDGSKVAGQVYKADSGNTYSNTANWVGMAPSAIASGATGIVRIAGSVSGLSALSIGVHYYVGSAGALTATAPTSPRKVGMADTATSLVMSPNPPPIPPLAAEPCGRLTGTTGVPVTTSDVTAITTLRYTPVLECNRIDLWDGVQLQTYTLTEKTIAVPATTATAYWVYVFDSNGAPTLELEAWTNVTTPATTPTPQNGFYAKASTPTRRLIGTMLTTAVSGQTEDSDAKRFINNLYRRVPRRLRLAEASTWNYDTHTLRQAAGSTTNQVEVMVTWANTFLDLSVQIGVRNSGGAGRLQTISIGEDSTTVGNTNVLGVGTVATTSAAVTYQLAVTLKKYPAIGYHKYVHLEAGDGNATTTWDATDVNALISSVGGMLGYIWG